MLPRHHPRSADRLHDSTSTVDSSRFTPEQERLSILDHNSVADEDTPLTERLTLTVEEAARMLRISRALAYEAVRRNEIRHITIGRRILIPTAVIAHMLEAAEAETPTTHGFFPSSQVGNDAQHSTTHAVERDHSTTLLRPDSRR